MKAGFRRVVWFLPGLILVACLWTFISSLQPRLVPAPWHVLPLFARLLRQGLLGHAGATLLRTLLAVLASFLIALPLGILMAKSAKLDKLLAPLVYLIFPVPKIALFPVIMLLIGLNDLSRITVVSLVLVFQMLLEVRSCVKTMPPEYLVAASVLGANRWQKVRMIVWPFILPHVFSALRVGSGTALAVLFFAETFFSGFGLGFFIMDSWMRIAYAEMYAGILMLALLGASLFVVLDYAEKKACPWKRDRPD